MNGVRSYDSLPKLVTRLRSDLNDIPVVLVFAHNRTGKTRLSMAFKDAGKRTTRRNPEGTRDTLYFNAFTEDLFVWDNDLDGDTVRHLVLNRNSRFFDALRELALDETIYGFLSRYTDIDFDIDYETLRVSFRKGEQVNIKISRGEQNLFIWCLFVAICERMLDGHDSYAAYRYIYIDDPISSLDDNNAISMACDLAKLLRRTARRMNDAGENIPLRVVLSTHHALFFNVMCNELGRQIDGASVRHKRYYLHRPHGADALMLRGTDETPFFHHIATLSELKKAADPATGTLYTFHFNALRTIMEKTASFFGHTSIAFCLQALDTEDDRALFNRALNLLSHGPYAIHEPSEMGEDNKQLFRRILDDFTTKFQFALPDLVAAPSRRRGGQARPAATEEANIA